MADPYTVWLGLGVFIGFPMYYLLTDLPYSKRDDKYYGHLASNSRVFPQGRWRLVFPIAWTILYVLISVAGYYFWLNADVFSSWRDAGLALHLFGLWFNFAWMNVFFRRRMPVTAFFLTLAIDGCAIFFVVASGVLAQPISYGLYIPYLVWLLYATIMGAVAAFVVPPYVSKRYKKTDDLESGKGNVPADFSTNPPSAQEAPFYNENSQIANQMRQLAQIQQQQHHHQQFAHAPQQQQFYAGMPSVGGRVPGSVQAHQQQQQNNNALPQLQLPQSVARLRPGSVKSV